MTTLRRISYAALGVAFTHLVFGAIVRISGSGLGCGENWPKCQGYWIPPMSRPDLVIEVTHRYLATLLILSLLTLAVAAIRMRREPGVGGRGGVLRPALTAALLVFVVAAFGAVTVFYGNPAWATVVHWTLAMSLVAVLMTAVIRAGGFGGTRVLSEPVSGRPTRAAYVAATMAFLAVVMGGLTAKVPSAAVGCLEFPMCGPNPAAPGLPHWIQLTHRTIAFLLILHLFGMVMAGRKRRESVIVRRATLIAFAFAFTQLLVAGAMIGMHLPPVLRSMHEAVGVSVWLSTFALAYLARRGSRATRAPVASATAVVEVPDDSVPESGRIVVPSPSAQANAMPDESAPAEDAARATPAAQPTKPHTVAHIIARGADL
jgi:heme A synthase